MRVKGYPLGSVSGVCGAPIGTVKAMVRLDETVVFIVEGGPQRPQKPSKKHFEKQPRKKTETIENI
jgi:hypothetical protein